MAYDDQDDLFEEEYDFVDDEDDSELADEEAVDEAEEEEDQPKKRAPRKRSAKSKPRSQAKKDEQDDEQAQGDEEAEEREEDPGPPPVPTDYVVHIYEFGNFQRTVAREFTGEDAEAFATEFNRTSKSYSRQAVAANKDVEAAPTL